MRSLSLFDLPFLAQSSPVAQIIDTFEEYAANDSLDGKNGGTGWNGAWVSRSGNFGQQAIETFETYTAGNGVNGLNGGAGFNGAWVSR